MEETKRRRFIIRAVLEGEVDVQEQPQPVTPYTFVEYITGDGNSYLDSGILPQEYDHVYLKFKMPTGSNIGIYGTHGSEATDQKMLACYSNYYWRIENGSFNKNFSCTGMNNTLAEVVHTCSTTQQKVDINGVNKTSSNSAGTASSSLTAYICAINAGNNEIYDAINQGTFYEVVFYSGETEIAHLKPAIRNADEAVGMYDEVREIFLENQGSGAFTPGSEVW